MVRDLFDDGKGGGPAAGIPYLPPLGAVMRTVTPHHDGGDAHGRSRSLVELSETQHGEGPKEPLSKQPSQNSFAISVNKVLHDALSVPAHAAVDFDGSRPLPPPTSHCTSKSSGGDDHPSTHSNEQKARQSSLPDERLTAGEPGRPSVLSLISGSERGSEGSSPPPTPGDEPRPASGLLVPANSFAQLPVAGPRRAAVSADAPMLAANSAGGASGSTQSPQRLAPRQTLPPIGMPVMRPRHGAGGQAEPLASDGSTQQHAPDVLMRRRASSDASALFGPQRASLFSPKAGRRARVSASGSDDLPRQNERPLTGLIRSRRARPRWSTTNTPNSPIPASMSYDQLRKPTLATQAVMAVLAQRETVGFVADEQLEREGESDESGGKRARQEAIVLHPFSQVRLLWDMLLITLLVLALFYTPFRIAFLDVHHGADPAVFAWDRINDAFFLLDVVLGFRTGVITPTGRVSMEPVEIARQYARTEFPVALVSAIPWDLLQPAWMRRHWLTLVRLLRLPGLLHVFMRSGVMLLVPRSTRVVVKFAFATLVVAHWFAAAWFLCGDYTLGRIEHYGSSWLVNSDLADADALDQYVASLFWAFSQMSPGTGTGGIYPSNTLERGFAIFVMGIGAFTFTFGITNTIKAVTDKNKAQLRMTERIDELNSYMERNNLPLGTRQALREWFRFYGQSNLMFDESKVLEGVSPKLQAQALLAAHGELIVKVPFFRDVPEAAVVDVLWRIKPLLYAPNELVFAEGDDGDAMYVIKQGSVRVAKRDRVRARAPSRARRARAGVRARPGVRVVLTRRARATPAAPAAAGARGDAVRGPLLRRDGRSRRRVGARAQRDHRDHLVRAAAQAHDPGHARGHRPPPNGRGAHPRGDPPEDDAARPKAAAVNPARQARLGHKGARAQPVAESAVVPALGRPHADAACSCARREANRPAGGAGNVGFIVSPTSHVSAGQRRGDCHRLVSGRDARNLDDRNRECLRLGRLNLAQIVIRHHPACDGWMIFGMTDESSTRAVRADRVRVPVRSRSMRILRCPVTHRQSHSDRQ